MSVKKRNVAEPAPNPNQTSSFWLYSYSTAFSEKIDVKKIIVNGLEAVMKTVVVKLEKGVQWCVDSIAMEGTAAKP